MKPIIFFDIVKKISNYKHNNFYSVLSYFFYNGFPDRSTEIHKSEKYFTLFDSRIVGLFYNRHGISINYNKLPKINNTDNIICTEINDISDKFKDTKISEILLYNEFNEFNISIICMLDLYNFNMQNFLKPEYKVIFYDYYYLYHYFSDINNVKKHLDLVIKLINQYSYVNNIGNSFTIRYCVHISYSLNDIASDYNSLNDIASDYNSIYLIFNNLLQIKLNYLEIILNKY